MLANAQRISPWLIVILILAGATIATPAQEEESLKLTKTLLKSLTKDVLGDNEKSRAAAFEKLKQVSQKDLPQVMDSVRSGFVLPPKPDRKKSRGSFMVEIPCEEVEGGVIKFRVHLPKKYRHGTAMPLVIRSHGSSMDGEDIAPMWDAIGNVTDRFIAVTPTFPFGKIGESVEGIEPAVHAIYDEVYRYMLSNYCIDTDKVFLSGYFMGAGFSFLMGQIQPHRFAGMHLSGRLAFLITDLEASMALARYVPGYFIIGATDSDDRVSGHRKAAEYYKTVAGYAGEFQIVKGRGKDQPFFEDYDADAMGFFVNLERKKYPKSFSALWSWSQYDPKFRHMAQSYWIKALKLQSTTKCEVEVKSQKIEIVSPGLTKAELYLADEIVDLNFPITVTLDGKTVFEGKVERSVDFFREQIEQGRDAKLLYWSKLEISR